MTTATGTNAGGAAVERLETDYLVVGAGAGGMAFTDELLAHSDATITIVDRHHAPGGHWLHAYPFVRLHQPSANYGVSSVPLGEDTLDKVGTNAGFHELASADEIRAYYDRVMYRHFLPSGRVRYFPGCNYLGEHRFVSRISGACHEVRVHRKVIDTTYMEGSIPATSPPPFEVDDGARCVPAGQIVQLADAARRYVIIGAGKTALDVCVWLLERGVPAAAICWIKPREAWWLNRKFAQPLTLLPDAYRGVALELEAIARATSVDDLFERLERDKVFLRVDPGMPASMLRGAIVSEAELALLRQIRNVVRLGHVRRITRDEIVLDHGCVPTSEHTLHIHCTARGLAARPSRPIFEPGRVTTQPFVWGLACYQLAMLGVVEATIASDDEKNQLCLPMRNWDSPEQFAPAFLARMINDHALAQYPRLRAWVSSTRLNFASGFPASDDPRLVDSYRRIERFAAPAAASLRRILQDPAVGLAKRGQSSAAQPAQSFGNAREPRMEVQGAADSGASKADKGQIAV